jgi:endonuclease I
MHGRPEGDNQGRRTKKDFPRVPVRRKIIGIHTQRALVWTWPGLTSPCIPAANRSHALPPSGPIRKGVPPSLKKHPALFAAALLAACLAASAAWSDVILSELCDPKNNYQFDRFIEIYNSGPNAVDLTNWSVVAIANNVDVTTWPLSGTLPAGQARVCGGTTPVTAFTVDFQSATWSVANTGGYYNWNGKIGDGARLKDNTGTVIDQVLATGDLFVDSHMVRNSSITSPTPVFNAAEWTITAVTLATDATPGTHNGSLPPAGGPRISNIVTDPAVPAAGDPVAVQASVVARNGEVLAAVLSWGTTAGSLSNVIGMTLLSDSTYRTSDPIPAQSGGATVYYRIQADDDSASTLSTVRSYTLAGGGGGIPPTVVSVGEMSDSTLLVFFSEPVDSASGQNPANYTVGANVAVAAVRDPVLQSQVLITVRNLSAGTQTLTANAITDLTGDTAFGATHSFNYVDVSIPTGYYDSTVGLKGSALRIALHNIIKGHTSISYSAVLGAFATTDVKPNGKVWDPYSDIPGGTPPYEYSFGQTGQGATEGLGYNREHSFPQSWFNGVSPTNSDLWVLYPTDAKVNGYRSNYVYGNVATPSVTSLNGSKLGSSASAGYTGTVFEPIDPFKGDLARSQFYIATRYLYESGGWPGSPAFANQDFLPWAAAQYMQWATNDPVSWKERMRNGAIYVIQHNRNPFVDHPEYVAMIYDSNNVVVGVAENRPARLLQLRQNAPNPFAGRTTIGFDLARGEHVTLRVFDVTGRAVRTLADGAEMQPGSHRVEWDGRDDRGAKLGAGLYFCRLETGVAHEMKRLVLTR